MALFEGAIIRYKRTEDGVPKNCLFAKERDDGNIFFGIARCNLKEDVCKKATGRQVAKAYAEEAEQAHGTSSAIPFIVAGNGRWGKCERHLFPLVLKFFYGVP